MIEDLIKDIDWKCVTIGTLLVCVSVCSYVVEAIENYKKNKGKKPETIIKYDLT